MSLEVIKDDDWVVQKMCVDVGGYTLDVEQQKDSWECEQTRESWKWSVSYHGSVVASGSVNSAHDAKASALANLPVDPGNLSEQECGCD